KGTILKKHGFKSHSGTKKKIVGISYEDNKQLMFQSWFSRDRNTYTKDKPPRLRRRKIDVPLWAWRVESRWVWFRERSVCFKPFGQVGIRCEEFAERNKIGTSRIKQSISGFAIESSAGDKYAFIQRAKNLVNVRQGCGLKDVKIGEPHGRKRFSQRRV